MRKPSQSFRARLAPIKFHSAQEKRPTVRACYTFCERLFRWYGDPERQETLRYFLEKTVVPIGARCRHDLRLELLYLYKMYRADTPLPLVKPLLPRRPCQGAPPTLKNTGRK